MVTLLDWRLIVSHVGWQNPLSKLDIRTVGCLAWFHPLSPLQILFSPHLSLPTLSPPSRAGWPGYWFLKVCWEILTFPRLLPSETKWSRRHLERPVRIFALAKGNFIVSENRMECGGGTLDFIGNPVEVNPGKLVSRGSLSFVALPMQCLDKWYFVLRFLLQMEVLTL